MSGFWKGRRVFLTGHTGFKGGWLSLWLQRLGAQVTGYSLPPPTTPSLFETADVARGMKSVIGDLLDLSLLKRTLAESRPEVVFHLAAQPLVHAGYDDPVGTYATNLLGSVHLLEAVRVAGGVRAVVNVTTDKVYENRESAVGYTENDRLGGYDPYSNSKACVELASDSYRNSFFPTARYAQHGVALATARAGNVIGGGDWGTDRLVPDILRGIAAGKPVRIRRPDAVRPWQHVLEPLSGYLRLAELLLDHGPTYAEAWNFGPVDADTRPVRWLVSEIARLWPEARWELDTQVHPHETQVLKLDCAKAAARLQWRPRLALSTAIEWIVEWHRAHARGPSGVRALCETQIARFEALPT